MKTARNGNSSFLRFNNKGQQKALERVEELTEKRNTKWIKMPRIGLVAKNRACSELALKMKKSDPGEGEREATRWTEWDFA